MAAVNQVLPFRGAKTAYGHFVAAGTVMCLFGYEQGVFGGIIVGHELQEHFHHPSPSLTGFVTSIYDLGCFAGALAALLVGEWLGRKRMLVILTVIMTIGILIQTSAFSMDHLLWGRFIAGVGNGGNTATAPVWHVETSHQSAKGKAVIKKMVGQCIRLRYVEHHHSSLQRDYHQGSVAVPTWYSTYLCRHVPCNGTYVAAIAAMVTC